MKVLTLNAGSSSIKFKVIDMPAETVICSGSVERIGSKSAELSYTSAQHNEKQTHSLTSHSAALKKIIDLLLRPQIGAIARVEDIIAVGHRVVHGGDSFSQTTRISSEVKKEIKDFAQLAPLHNPHNLEGIEVAEQLFPKAKQIAVFDTAFHQTLPIKARKYAIPNHFFTDKRIKVYGFHGTSHKYVSEKAIDHLGLKSSKIISIHLGNGCSITAVVDGKSIDHSMGFTPSNGLVMGTRSGDIDHSVILYLMKSLNYTAEQINELVNKQSGMLGLTGHSDLRDIEKAAAQGDINCQLALAINTYRIKKFIGAYIAAMNGLDALIFTAGIGENSSLMRRMICADLTTLGIAIDAEKNEINNKNLREIQIDGAKVKILVIPTDEELEIAKQVYQILE